MTTRTLSRMTSLVTYLAAILALVLPAGPCWAAAKEKGVPDGAKSLSWTQATPAAGWSTRVGHATTVFNDRLWVIGGTHDGQHGLNDVWSSTDGVNWTEETANAPWSGRYGHAVVVLKGKLWILGGDSSARSLHDVWYSADGVTWENITESAEWSPRYGFTANVLNDRIFILGGAPSFNDVWASLDGETWTQVTEHAPWVERAGHESVLFSDGLWVLGGVYADPYSEMLNDIWSSTDGVSWVEKLSHAGWHVRDSHAVAVFNNLLWVLGGQYSTGSGPGSYYVGLNDVWTSENGTDWEQLPNAPWSPRASHAAVVFKNRLWILGGLGYEPFAPVNDGWYAETDPTAAFSGTPVSGDTPLTVDFTDESTGSSTITDWAWDFGDGGTSDDQDPSHTYTVRGLYTVSLTVTSDAGEDTETKEGYITVYGTPHAFHTADQDQDNDINLAELLRIIQFYNSDGFHCEAGTEDGYTPGPGDDTCALHDGDYAPPDWQISLSELLRVIQFYNAAGYESCPDGEDGFCVVTAK